MAPKQIKFEEFIEDWHNGLIKEVFGIGNYVYGKDYKGQSDNPEGFVAVYAILKDKDIALIDNQEQESITEFILIDDKKKAQ